MIIETENMGALISLAVDLGFVFGPVAGYVAQYNAIKRDKSAGNLL
jgi:hypothetical protein